MFSSLQKTTVASAALEFVVLCPAQAQQNRRDKSQPRTTTPGFPGDRPCRETRAALHWNLTSGTWAALTTFAWSLHLSEVRFEQVVINKGFPEPKAFAGAQRSAVLYGPSSCTNLRARLACTSEELSAPGAGW